MDSVNDFIQRGWQPKGPIIIEDDGWYTQVMVKKEKKKTKTFSLLTINRELTLSTEPFMNKLIKSLNNLADKIKWHYETRNFGPPNK